MNYFLLTFNFFGWPLIHLAVSKWALALPIESFGESAFLYRARSWERDGNTYERIFKVRAWKAKLPDGAAWFSGGFSKRQIMSRDPDYLKRFLAETCRGEWAHWITLSALPLFLIANPLWAQVVMIFYAAASNLPCIVAQRYNRCQFRRLLNKSAQLKTVQKF